jgi:hypothetical protein
MLNHALPAPTPGQDSAEQGGSSRGLQDPTTAPAALAVTEPRAVGLALRPVREATGATGATDAAGGGGIISRQVQRLILEILTDSDTDEQVRLGLLRHMAAHPGDPSGAMLAHLHDVGVHGDRTGYGDAARDAL